MTVNNPDNSSLTDAGRSLAILQDLCGTITRTSEAEALTIRELRTLRYSGDKEGSAAFQEVDTGLGNAAAGVDAEYGARWDRLRRHHETRHLKIEQLRQTGLRDLPRRVEEVRSSYLGDLQRQKLRLERQLADEKQAVARQAGDPAVLGERKEALDKLIARTKRAFSGSVLLTKRLSALAAEAKTGPFPPGSPDERLSALGSHLEKADGHLTVIRNAPLARLFGIVPGYVMALLGLLAGIIIAFLGGFAGAALWIGIAVALGLAGTAVAGMFSTLGQGPAAAGLTEHLGHALRLHHAVGEEGAEFIARRHGELDERHAAGAALIQEKWQAVDAVAAAFREKALTKLNTQPQRLLERNEARMEQRRVQLDAEHSRAVAALESGAAAERARAEEVRTRNAQSFAAEEARRWTALTDRWKQEATPLITDLQAAAAAAEQAFPPWNAGLADTWVPADRFLPVTRIGTLHVDLATHPGKLPADPRLALPGPAAMDVPVCLSYPDHGSLLFETCATAGTEMVTGSLNNVILRLLASVPPGKLSFTIIDPVGLGQNFAGLMHLGDFEESLINRRIWTQRDQIEERLAELSEHIEKVIQMYLRNEYETITQYNEQAGSVAEKYYFLTVSDFPSQFSDVAVRRLMSIATSGSRCGVFTLIHWDTRLPSPDGFVPDELRKSSLVIRQEKSGAFVLGNGPSGPGTALHLDPPPDADVSMALVQKIGKASIDSNRVEVPFRQIAPAPDALWTGDTTSELRIAVGRTGATKHQFLAIGKGTRQHALFAGKTGSGKSTLFHVIITNLALTCSPEQVEFYLIDFKKGVEFKCYATHHLPHARVVAIESDREFALSVLQRVDDELKRRGDKFRKLGVQDIAGYKRAGGTDPIPRTLLIIDEFQEFFVEDDTIAQSASLLFDRIVRQGRAFGIHVLLGSQTLGGAYSLARATLGQMVIRVALMCNEADAYLIMDDSNSAPRLLSRPGEGIYNDAAGAVEGNSPFQVVWLPDEERDQWLEKVETLARERGTSLPPPVVFEGNAPADLGENELLRRCLATPVTQAAPAGRLWLGAPNSIKGPTEAVFRRQSGNHLLIVGQRDEAALTMLGVGLLSLAAQYPAGGVRFYVIDITPPGSPEAAFLERVVAAIPHEVTVARAPEVPAVMGALAAGLKERSGGEVDSSTAPPVYVFLHGMHKFKKLRQEDDFSFSMDDSEDTGNPAKQFTDIITEGSTHGIHLIATVDTFNNVNRSINRKALTEFEMRVVFQMSANDSASLIDSPRASTLGLHRALFYNEQEGTLETFRPYATPELAWVDSATAALHPTDVV